MRLLVNYQYGYWLQSHVHVAIMWTEIMRSHYFARSFDGCHAMRICTALRPMEFLRELESGAASAVLIRWMVDYMWVAPLFSLIYFLAVFGGRSWMRFRKPFMLRRELIAWNTLLAVFSVVGFVRVTPLMLRKWTQVGVVGSVCSSLRDEQTLFWLVLFTLSKVVEFGDTAFVVLRKSPLIFLHWYHHITVSLYTWYNAGRLSDSVGHWFAWMNFGVHAVMYTYYAFKAMGLRVPKGISKLVTMLQLLQFTVGLVCILIASWHHFQGHDCFTSSEFIISGLLLYGSYLVLFVSFFYNRYLK